VTNELNSTKSKSPTLAPPNAAATHRLNSIRRVTTTQSGPSRQNPRPCSKFQNEG
jgi:hypothetical protein